MNRLLGNNTRRPDITFRADGRIDITSRIAKVLDLAPGDVIDVAEVFDGEFCLYVRHRACVCGRHEGRCYPVMKGYQHGAYRVWRKRLCDAVRAAANYSADYLRLPCGDPIEINGQLHIPIILKLAL